MGETLHWSAGAGLIPGGWLLAAAWIGARLVLGYGAGDAGERWTARIANLVALGSLVLVLLLDLLAWREGTPGRIGYAVWLAGEHWRADLSLLLDRLSLTLATLTAWIGWLTLRFSRLYLHREPGFQRFFLALCLFMAGMQLVWLAGNGLLAFIGWELCGAMSFLLIGYAWERPRATSNALFAFVVNRGGDAGFVLALGLAAAWLGSLEWTVIAGGTTLSELDARLLLFGFVLAAAVKSGQLPFTPWLTRALEGPTPSSAIFYGAVMVHAGVYLLLRLEPLLAQAPDIGYGIAALGALTALYAACCAWVQTDVKSALIHGVIYQVGLMFLAIGLGWTTWATVHLCLHAAWRSWQFLLAPSWLAVTQAAPAPPPGVLARRQSLYTAALNGFWLDRLGQVLLLEPTLGFARDVRRLEREFIEPVLGAPEHGQALDPERPLVVVAGLPGVLLARLADRLQRVEDRLLLRAQGGAAERALRQVAHWLAVLEQLLEQPRYLMMAVMVTFVVIL